MLITDDSEPFDFADQSTLPPFGIVNLEMQSRSACERSRSEPLGRGLSRKRPQSTELAVGARGPRSWQSQRAAGERESVQHFAPFACAGAGYFFLAAGCARRFEALDLLGTGLFLRRAISPAAEWPAGEEARASADWFC